MIFATAMLLPLHSTAYAAAMGAAAPLAGVLLFYCTVTVLHAVLPGITCQGYACAWDGTSLRYHLNGPLLVLAVLAVPFALPTEVVAYAAANFAGCVSAATRT